MITKPGSGKETVQLPGIGEVEIDPLAFREAIPQDWKLPDGRTLSAKQFTYALAILSGDSHVQALDKAGYWDDPSRQFRIHSNPRVRHFLSKALDYASMRKYGVPLAFLISERLATIIGEGKDRDAIMAIARVQTMVDGMTAQELTTPDRKDILEIKLTGQGEVPSKGEEPLDLQ